MTTPYYQDDLATVLHGDCRAVLAGLPDASVDAVVTDPPYELGFMGKGWDASGIAYDPVVWAECLRVLKPGGHLLAFGGTRTWHRLTCAIEDAGFEVRDSIAWLYGSGFPKSLDVSKAIDRQRTEDRAPVDAVRSWLNARRVEAGLSHDAVNKHFGHASNGGGSSSAWMTNPTSRSLPTWDQWLDLKALFGFADDMDAEVWRLNGRKGKPGDNFEAREVLSERVSVVEGGNGGWSDMVASGRFRPGEKIIRETAPATPDAARWQGWGTALKPAFEPIVVARKPLSGTVASNVLAHGTGALNVDGCRVAHRDAADLAESVGKNRHADYGTTPGGNAVYGDYSMVPSRNYDGSAGRWPANVLLDESQAEALDAQSGVSRDGVAVNRNRDPEAIKRAEIYGEYRNGARVDQTYGGEGGASRFFPTFRYEAKAPTAERPVTFHPSCECENSWPTPTPSTARATAATTEPGSSSTSRPRSANTDAPSPTDTRSTTSTATSRTTTPPTSSRSPRPITSASTLAANCETAGGGSPAASADSSSPSAPRTGTSAARGGRSMDGAGRATSPAWSATSVCGECGAPSRREAHATVKPLDLMRWLVRLVTPPGGLVLDPFAGSGTTAEACIIEGFRCIAIEREADYLPLILARLTKPIAPVLDFTEATA